MQIHNLPAQTTATDADVLAIDNGATTQKITMANLGKKVAEDAKPAFTSNDSATANAWTNVAVLASAETMKSILNKISTMFKNIRYLYGAVTQLNTDLNTKTRYTATLNSEYFSSGTVYVHVDNNTISIMGSDLTCAKQIDGNAVTIATNSHIAGQTGGAVYFLIYNYTKSTVLRGRVSGTSVDIPYPPSGSTAINDKLYFCVTYLTGTTAS